MKILWNAKNFILVYISVVLSVSRKFAALKRFKYLNWQIIDTPGILDHELEERNAIEWQSVTAMAHLKAAIIYIVDISETCGTPIQTQIDLFMKIKPLFVDKVSD